MKASDLPWWEWLLVAVAAAFASGFSFVAVIADTDSPAGRLFPILFPMLKQTWWLSVTIILLGAVVAVSCAIIGIIRLIKWASLD